MDWKRVNYIQPLWIWSHMVTTIVKMGSGRLWNKYYRVIVGRNQLDWQRTTNIIKLGTRNRMVPTIVSMVSGRSRHKYDIDIARWNLMD